MGKEIRWIDGIGLKIGTSKDEIEWARYSYVLRPTNENVPNLRDSTKSVDRFLIDIIFFRLNRAEKKDLTVFVSRKMLFFSLFLFFVFSFFLSFIFETIKLFFFFF